MIVDQYHPKMTEKFTVDDDTRDVLDNDNTNIGMLLLSILVLVLVVWVLIKFYGQLIDKGCMIKEPGWIIFWIIIFWPVAAYMVFTLDDNNMQCTPSRRTVKRTPTN